MLCVKKVDVIRSLFDYLEKGKTIGECLDAVPVIDLAAMRAELMQLSISGDPAELVNLDSVLEIVNKYMGVIE